MCGQLQSTESKIHKIERTLPPQCTSKMHIPFFRIFYSTTFTGISLLLMGLMLITPVDQVYQAFGNDRTFIIFIIPGTHFLTLLVAIFIYANRLFMNRRVLATIPKSWSPIEKGDVEKRVRRIVKENLRRSALIAYEARPRNLQDDATPAAVGEGVPNTAPEDGRHGHDNNPDDGPVPIWGTISHPGWSSPSSLDLPSLHYDPVIIELPHLIEAKAVSLAPADPLPITPSSPGGSPEPPLPDALAVELLQRPATMGFRDYISHLTSLDMIHPPTLGESFLALYEKARFSGRPLGEEKFRELMNVFAEILRGMTMLDLAIVASLHAEEEEGSIMGNESISGSSEVDGDSTQTINTVEYTPRHPSIYHFDSPSSSSAGSPRTARTSLQHHHSSGIRARADIRSPPSMASIRSHSSGFTQRSAGSLIRLAETRGPLDLPYTILTSK